MTETAYIAKDSPSDDKGLKRPGLSYLGYTTHRFYSLNFRVKSEFSSQSAPKSWLDMDSAAKKFRTTDAYLVEMIDAEKESFLEEDYFTDNWDGLGAEAVSKELFHRCTAVLKKYAQALSLENTHDVQVDIDPLPTGSIDAVWYGKQARLLMNFDFEEQGRIILRYYGESEDRLGSIKNQLGGEAPSSVLLAWMNEHF